MRRSILLTVSAASLCAGAAQAQETILYRYDVHGRLVQVSRSGTVNNGVITSYVYDKADNRRSKTTSGSSNPPPP